MHDGPERYVRLAATLRAERDRIARVVDEGAQALLDFTHADPPVRDMRGIGAILHDFYTGAERIFERIAPELNGGVPEGAAWHRELLDNMTLDLPGVRPAVIAPATARALGEYLRFRHLFRNLYGYEIEWSRLRPLLERLPSAWTALRDDIEGFLAFLDAAGRDPA